MDEKIFVPEPPVITGALAELPENVKKQWRETYAKAFRQAQMDSPNEAGVHPQRARKAANALLEVSKPSSYEEAMALPGWQVVKRLENDGQLTLVTIEARGPERGDSKFIFEVPRKSRVAAAFSDKKDGEKK
jgi:hypothetical protein